MGIYGWGRYPRVDADIYSADSNEQLQKFLANNDSIIPYALGRSYGDSALSTTVIRTTRLNCILDFDQAQGLVDCEAGVSLAELIDTFLPQGWFLPITPGTKYITIGGAIASDVHGKNHHVAGCFSECVASFELMIADGTIVECSKEKNTELFQATCGGMGLTGLITSAKVQLKKVSSAFIDQKILRAKNLDHSVELFDKYASVPYSVAWIDCLAKGTSLGRSLVMIGDHAAEGGLLLPDKKKVTIPVDFPSFTLNRFSVSAFNALYYKRIKENVVEKTTDIDSFFYPLDAVGNWNRIYGKAGFTQYQFVLPRESSKEGLKKILERISGAGLGSFLAVLKLFGPENSNYLSFPHEGLTLALDFKIENKLFPLLDTLDALVLDYGGRLYLTKDVRMSKDTLRAGYPQLDKFIKVRDQVDPKRKFESLQSKRLEI